MKALTLSLLLIVLPNLSFAEVSCVESDNGRSHICSGESVGELYNYYEEFVEEFESCFISPEDSQDAKLYCLLKPLDEVESGFSFFHKPSLIRKPEYR
ncbi:MAG: hypothetical protein ACRBBP_11470 [Bdellovibrionales bacterium]